VKPKPKSFKASLLAYEKWLRTQVDVWDDDLCEKHRKMKCNAVSFLRATYWRWAERIFDPDVCPELDYPPHVLAVGDIHIENFGTWRDNDGRLVWGVNDFDEAAEMPYTLDLVRLATSAILGRSNGDLSPEDICKHLLRGYIRGLKRPEPLILDERHHWLLKQLKVRPRHRNKFWDKIDGLPSGKPDAGYRDAINTALPGPDIKLTFRKRHSAGTGSLGRPRWVGVGEWRGGPVVREAKALVPSAWALVHSPNNLRIHCGELASGRYRAPDPYYDVIGNIVVRRLSPNNRKIELGKAATPNLATARILRAMGREIAALHRCSAVDPDDIRADLSDRGDEWLLEAATLAADFVCADCNEWRDSAD